MSLKFVTPPLEKILRCSNGLNQITEAVLIYVTIMAIGPSPHVNGLNSIIIPKVKDLSKDPFSPNYGTEQN